jgi:protein-arginine kinase activator protein McsA
MLIQTRNQTSQQNRERCEGCNKPKKESLLERYWRLRGEADELYRKRMKEINQRINEEMRKSIRRELDALEDAIEKADLIEVLRHKLIIEVLLG